MRDCCNTTVENSPDKPGYRKRAARFPIDDMSVATLERVQKQNRTTEDNATKQL
jgi:hypothetical protein